MGLEIVELVMRAEEEFEIEIGDEEASLCATAGQLCRLIGLKLSIEPDFSASAPSGCRSSAAFYRTRRDLVALTGLSRREIGPQTLLQQVFPALNRRRMWQQFKTRSGTYLPDLQVSQTLFSSIALGTLALWAFSYACFAAGEFLAAIGGLLGGFCCLAAFASDSPFARRFPASCATVGDLSGFAMRAHFEATSAGTPQDQFWLRVQFLVADELGVPLELVTPDADFYRDLGAG